MPVHAVCEPIPLTVLMQIIRYFAKYKFRKTAGNFYFPLYLNELNNAQEPLEKTDPGSTGSSSSSSSSSSSCSSSRSLCECAGPHRCRHQMSEADGGPRLRQAGSHRKSSEVTNHSATCI